MAEQAAEREGDAIALPEASSTVPEGEDRRLRHIRNALIGLLVLAAASAVVIGRDFLVPVAFAFFIALTFRPVIRRLSKRGIPAWVTTSGIACLLALALLAFLVIFGSAVTDWVARWPDIRRTFLERNSSLLDWLNQILDLTQAIADPVPDSPAAPAAAEVVVRQPVLPTVITFVTAYPVNVTITLTTAIVIALFLMASGDLFYEKLIHILPRLNDKKSALRIVFDVEREVSNYLITIVVINAGLAAAVGLCFWLAGMPMPVFWALLAFVLNFIPYLGPIAGVVTSGFVAAVVSDNLSHALIAPASYMLLIGLETQIITPSILSRRMSLNSVAILLALAFWGWAWGIAGIVMAVPFLVTLRVFCGHLTPLQPIGEFLAGRDNGPMEAAARSSSRPAA